MANFKWVFHVPGEERRGKHHHKKEYYEGNTEGGNGGDGGYGGGQDTGYGGGQARDTYGGGDTEGQVIPSPVFPRTRSANRCIATWPYFLLLH